MNATITLARENKNPTRLFRFLEKLLIRKIAKKLFVCRFNARQWDPIDGKRFAASRRLQSWKTRSDTSIVSALINVDGEQFRYWHENKREKRESMVLHS